MRPLQSIALVTALIALAACDDVSPGTKGEGAPKGPVPTLDQTAPGDKDIPPRDPVRQAPVDTARVAPDDAVQSAPTDVNAPSAVTSASCAAVCSKVAALGCGGSSSCTTLCTQFDAAPGCQTQASALMSCASSAQDCGGLEACENEYEAFASCVTPTDDLTNNPPSKPAPTNYTIKDSACTTSNVCQACAPGSCDQCICALQIASATASTQSCASFCK